MLGIFQQQHSLGFYRKMHHDPLTVDLLPFIFVQYYIKKCQHSNQPQLYLVLGHLGNQENINSDIITAKHQHNVIVNILAW